MLSVIDNVPILTLPFNSMAYLPSIHEFGAPHTDQLKLLLLMTTRGYRNVSYVHS